MYHRSSQDRMERNQQTSKMNTVAAHRAPSKLAVKQRVMIVLQDVTIKQKFNKVRHTFKNCVTFLSKITIKESVLSLQTFFFFQTGLIYTKLFPQFCNSESPLFCKLPHPYTSKTFSISSKLINSLE